jgi:hypothetical protein
MKILWYKRRKGPFAVFNRGSATQYGSAKYWISVQFATEIDQFLTSSVPQNNGGLTV